MRDNDRTVVHLNRAISARDFWIFSGCFRRRKLRKPQLTPPSQSAAVAAFCDHLMRDFPVLRADARHSSMPFIWGTSARLNRSPSDVLGDAFETTIAAGSTNSIVLAWDRLGHWVGPVLGLRATNLGCQHRDFDLGGAVDTSSAGRSSANSLAL